MELAQFKHGNCISKIFKIDFFFFKYLGITIYKYYCLEELNAYSVLTAHLSPMSQGLHIPVGFSSVITGQLKLLQYFFTSHMILSLQLHSAWYAH